MVKTGPAPAAFFLLFSLASAGLVHAAEPERELQGIKKKIEQERQGITKVKKKEESILGTLAKIDDALEKKNKELKRVNARLEAVLRDLKKKQAEAENVRSSLGARTELFRRRARALYEWRRAGAPLELLDDARSLADRMRRRYYLEIALAYDRTLIDRLSDETARQQALKQELEQKKREVDRQRKTLTAINESIRADRQKKEVMLAGIRREKEGRERALQELQQAAQRLQKMIDEIARRSALAKEAPPGTGFEALRGKLDYPVRGAVMAAFGKTQHPEFSAELFRKGIDIDAPIGEEVRAVETGKVVFADRFSGYGKMMIVDHGQRYYTVYAHLSDLLKNSGDTVRRGEPIALVGDSDSLAGARLYFEIRKDGKPLDPMPWFKK